MASGAAGFCVEPNKKRWEQTAGTGAEYKDIKDKDTQAKWYFEKYQDGMKGQGERVNSFIVTKLSDDGTRATAKTGKEYPVREKLVKTDTTEIKTLDVDVWAGK
jgi:hypothetical protein